MKLLYVMLLLVSSLSASYKNLNMMYFYCTTDSGTGKPEMQFHISVDEAELVCKEWRGIALREQPFGLFDGNEMPNEMEMVGLVFCMTLATRGEHSYSNYQFGVYHGSKNDSYGLRYDHGAREAILVLLDTFRKWLDENPEETKKYIGLAKSRRELGYADRAKYKINYDAFIDKLAWRIDRPGTNDEHKKTVAFLIKKWQLIACPPEFCQQTEMNVLASNKKTDEYEKSLKVNANVPSIFGR